MFKTFESVSEHTFKQTVMSSECTADALMRHVHVAKSIVMRSGLDVENMSVNTDSLMKRVVDKLPHLERPLNTLLAAEAGKKRFDNHTPSVGKIVFGSLVAAIAILAGIAGQERKAYHHEVAAIPSLDVPPGVQYPAPSAGANPVEHVQRVLDGVEQNSTEGQLWDAAKENSAARTQAQRNHRGGVAGIFAKAFRAGSGTKDSTLESLQEKYAKRFDGDVLKVVLKIGNPSKTNATADGLAFVVLQIIAPIAAVGATGWTAKLIKRRADGQDEVVGVKKGLTKKQALGGAETLENEYGVKK